jgi:phosphatidylserine decarboxylase
MDQINNKDNDNKKSSDSSIIKTFKGLLTSIYIFFTHFIKQTHSEGYIFVGISLIITIFVGFFSSFFGLLFFMITIWVIAFFRDPKRITPDSPNVVFSAADGKISDIRLVKPPIELGLGDVEMYRISTFLNVFNVHTNKFPVSGTVEKIIYYPGKFLNAELDKSSELNERNSIILKNQFDEQKIAVVQIAGFIARRIVCFTKENDNGTVGKNFGIIRFGSRVDVYVPKSYIVVVQVGQTMIGGETPIANAKTN